VPFALDDGTGRAIIDPQDSVLDLVVDERDASGTDHAPTGRELILVTRLGLDPKEWLTVGRSEHPFPADRDFVFREAIIGVGEEIAILGSGVREPDPDAPPEAAYRGTQPTRLCMSSGRDRPMIISDHPSKTR
jgi:hypothetical protein